MSQRLRILVALALAACCSAALASVAVSNFRPFGNGAGVAGIVTAADGTHVVLVDSTTGPVLLRIGADNSVVRAVHTGFVHATSLAKIPSGFLLAGGGLSDTPWVMKVREQFEVDWAENLDGDFRPDAICATSDGSIYVGGYVTGDANMAALMKLAGDGSILWRRTFHGGGFDEIKAIQPTKDGVVAAGEAECGASLWRVISDGTLGWQRCFSSGRVTAFSAVTSVEDGDIIAAGRNEASLIIVKTNSTGLFRWKISGAGTYLADASDVVLSEHQIVVAGTAAKEYNNATLVVAAFTFDGKLAWQRSYGSPEETSAIALSSFSSHRNAAPDHDGGVAVGVGIGDALRFVRFRRDGSLDGDCSGLAANTLTFAASPPVGRSSAIETKTFGGAAHNVHAAMTTTAVQSAPACATSSPVTAELSDQGPSHQTRDVTAVYKQAADLLIARKFAELDALADEWRRTGAKLDPLYPKLLLLYDSVAGQTVSSQIGEDAQEALLKEWIASRPASSTAVLALGRYDITQAYAKRGMSSTPTDKGSEEFDRYIQAAQKLLREHQQLATVDPQYYAILMSAGADGSIYFQAGNAQSDVDVIGDAAVFLLPQWGGTPEEYKHLMDVAVAKTKADVGETMYARIAWRLVRYACCDKTKLWETYGLDWARVKQGFLDWSARSPYPTPLHRLAILAYGRKDRATLAEILKRPEIKWDDVAQAEWGSRSGFDEASSWAFGKASDLATPVPPPSTPQAAPAVTPIGPRTWPEMLLDSDVTLTNGEHRRVWAFLVNGPNGVVAVSSIEAFRSRESPESPIVLARKQIAAWKLSRPAEPRRSVTVNGFITPMTSLAGGILLAIPPSTGAPIRQPLNVSETSPKMGSKVYVAGCSRTAAAPCKQWILQSEVIGAGSGNDRKGNPATKFFSIQPDGISSDDLIGAPVLNEDGFAVGVVIRSGPLLGGKQALDCDDLPFLMTVH